MINRDTVLNLAINRLKKSAGIYHAKRWRTFLDSDIDSSSKRYFRAIRSFNLENEFTALLFLNRLDLAESQFFCRKYFKSDRTRWRNFCRKPYTQLQRRDRKSLNLAIRQSVKSNSKQPAITAIEIDSTRRKFLIIRPEQPEQPEQLEQPEQPEQHITAVAGQPDFRKP